MNLSYGVTIHFSFGLACLTLLLNLIILTDLFSSFVYFGYGDNDYLLLNESLLNHFLLGYNVGLLDYGL